MKESVIATIRKYTDTSLANEVSAAVREPNHMTFEQAAKIATRHHKGIVHKNLLRAIKSNDRKAVGEHFRAAHQAVLEAMKKHHGGKTSAPKPVEKKLGVEQRESRKLPAAKKKAPFRTLLEEHPAYADALRSKRKNPHEEGTLAHRAYNHGMEHRVKLAKK